MMANEQKISFQGIVQILLASTRSYFLMKFWFSSGDFIELLMSYALNTLAKSAIVFILSFDRTHLGFWAYSYWLLRLLKKFWIFFWTLADLKLIFANSKSNRTPIFSNATKKNPFSCFIFNQLSYDFDATSSHMFFF